MITWSESDWHDRIQKRLARNNSMCTIEARVWEQDQNNYDETYKSTVSTASTVSIVTLNIWKKNAVLKSPKVVHP
jgi:hypothetical protein